MNGTSTITEFRDAVLDPAKRAHYRLAWLSTVDHKRIAVLYMMTALVFFIIGGTEALFMRLQLAVPNNHFLQPDTFNQLFTMHGTTMIFLVVMPVLFGLVNYVLPLQIGARDMAFPRLNAFGFWCVPFGGILLHFSVLAGGAPAVGWFSYAPLSETPYSSSPGVDYWAVAIFVLGIGSLSFAINTIATVISLRGPGMTMRRLPLFTWINFVNAFIIIFALPVLNAGPGDDPDRSSATGPFLSTHWRRFSPFCGSTSFGRLAIRKFTSWPFPHSASSPKSFRFFRGNRFSVTNLLPLRA